MKSGVHSSLHEHRHHQVTYVKFNLENYDPPPYEREIWHYQKINIEKVREATDQFSWAMLLQILMPTRK